MATKNLDKFYIASSRDLSDEFWENLSATGITKSECITSHDQLQMISKGLGKGARIFFPHWSWVIPEHIYSLHECVMFHMTDLPFGRGGSPLQNLLISGMDQTVITAFRCVKELDSGPVYSKVPLSLSGSAHEIFKRADYTISLQIVDFLRNPIEPTPQDGEATYFTRRTADQSNFSEALALDDIQRLIRALDAPGYRQANIKYGSVTYFFSDALFRDGEIRASVRIVHEGD